MKECNIGFCKTFYFLRFRFISQVMFPSLVGGFETVHLPLYLTEHFRPICHWPMITKPGQLKLPVTAFFSEVFLPYICLIANQCTIKPSCVKPL